MTPTEQARPRADRRSTSPYGLGSATTSSRHELQAFGQDPTSKTTDAKWSHFKPPRRGRCELPLPITVARAQTEVSGLPLVYGPPKSAAAHRTIKVPGQVAGILADYLASQPNSDPAALVFTTPSGTPVRQTNFYKRVFQPAVRATLPEHKHSFRFHDLRHTCASLCLSSTPNLHIVKERLGHEDIRTTVNLYGHMVPSVDAALADALDALFAQSDNVLQLSNRAADNG